VEFSENVQAVIERGRTAFKRRQDSNKDEIADWWAIGEALAEPERELLHKLGLNRPQDGGQKWSKAWGAFLRESGFIQIERSVRSRLRSCIEHRVEIETWLAGLDPTARLNLNHPSWIWKKWNDQFGVSDGKQSKDPSAAAKKAEQLEAQIYELTKERDDALKEIDRLKQETNQRADDPAFAWTKNPTSAAMAMIEASAEGAHILAQIIIGEFGRRSEAEPAGAQRMTGNDLEEAPAPDEDEEEHVAARHFYGPSS
jgi:hypothetical protein